MTRPADLRVVRTTVYFDPSTGDIVHVHRIATAGEELDDDRIDEEAAAFEESLERRHGRSLDQITVDETELRLAIAPEVHLRVDTTARALVRDDRG